MRFRKRGLIFVILNLLFTIGVFAQSFGFEYGRSSGVGRNSVSGVAGAITTALDVIFGGVVRPIFDAVRFDFFGSIKLALWIILYLVFSSIFQKFFTDKLPGKFSKVIAAILALFSVAFMPERLLDLLFRDLLGGLVGALLLLAAVGLPLYFLFMWGREHSEDRAVNLVSALLFFLLIIIFSQLQNQFVYAFNSGFIQGLVSIIVTFGILFALAMFIQRLIAGFKGSGGTEEESSPRRERNEERRGDELSEIRAAANELNGLVTPIRDQIQAIPDEPNALANQIFGAPNLLDFISHAAFSDILGRIANLSAMLDNTEGGRARAGQISRQLAAEYREIHATLGRLNNLRGRTLHSHIAHQRADVQFFGRLSTSLDELEEDLDSLSRVLLMMNNIG